MDNKKVNSKEIHETILQVMSDIKTLYQDQTEYKPIMMNLTTVAKEVNAIRIREITGELNGSTTQT